jgi:hypothetical protein
MNSHEKKSLTRVVKLSFDPQHIETFRSILADHIAAISNMEGCIRVQGFQDAREPYIFFTISEWENEQALDNYRYSPFFKNLWAKVKPLFAEKAMAHSLLAVV